MTWSVSSTHGHEMDDVDRQRAIASVERTARQLEGYLDYGDPWPPPRPGRVRSALRRLGRWLNKLPDPAARIHPDGGPEPFYGPYPWEET